MLLVNGSMQIIVEGIDFVSSLMIKHEINHKIMMLEYNFDREQMLMFHYIIKHIEYLISFRLK